MEIMVLGEIWGCAEASIGLSGKASIAALLLSSVSEKWVATFAVPTTITRECTAPNEVTAIRLIVFTAAARASEGLSEPSASLAVTWEICSCHEVNVFRASLRQSEIERTHNNAQAEMKTPSPASAPTESFSGVKDCPTTSPTAATPQAVMPPKKTSAIRRGSLRSWRNAQGAFS